MNLRTITAVAAATLLFGVSGPAFATEHIYSGAFCKQVNGGTDLQTAGWGNTASNLNSGVDINVTCPIVNLEPSAHSPCVTVQAWDTHGGANLVDNVHCRITWRSTGSAFQGDVETYSETTTGRFDFEVEDTLASYSAYALYCTIPDMEAGGPSNIESYIVSDDGCFG